MKRLILFLCFSLAVSAFSFGQSDTDTVAIVHLHRTEQVTVRQLRNYVSWHTINKSRSTGNPNAVLTESERRQVLDILVNVFLVVQAATQEGMAISDSEFNREFEQWISALTAALVQRMERPIDADVDAAILWQTGMTREIFRVFWRREMIVQNYVLRKFPGITTEEEFVKAGEELVADLRRRGSVQIIEDTYNRITW